MPLHRTVRPALWLAASCLSLMLAACGGGDSGGSTRTAPAYALGGTVSGLDEGYVDLRNGLDVQRISANPNGLGLDAPFTFTTTLPAGSGYNVRIINDPQAEFGLQCEVDHSTGTMPASAVSNVAVRCARVNSVRHLAGAMTPATGRDGLATQVALNGPRWLAFDTLGNLYVSENQAIRRITPAGASSIMGSLLWSAAAMAVDAQGNVYTVQGYGVLKTTPAGITTQAAGVIFAYTGVFDWGRGIAIDSAGSYYVPDSIPPQVRVFRDGEPVANFGPNLYASLVTLRGIAIDRQDRVFVCHVDQNLLRLTILHVTASAASAVTSMPVSSTETCLSLAVDSAGTFHFADGNSIVALTPNGQVTRTQGFSSPAGVVVDPAGNRYVVNGGDSTVRRIAPNGTSSLYAGIPHPPGTIIGEAAHADGSASTARFNSPDGMVVNADGDVFVADNNNHVIRRITASGQVTTFAGSPSQTGHADGTGSAARFNGPSGIAIDPAGNLYVADRGNRTIRRITPQGVVSTLAGQAGTQSDPARDGQGSAARFSGPDNIAASSSTIFVQDGTGVRSIDLAGNVSTLPAVPGGALPSALALHNDGKLYAWHGTSLYSLESSGQWSSAAQFEGESPAQPTRMTLGPDGEFYVSDAANNAIYRMRASGYAGITRMISSQIAGIRGTSRMELGPLPGLIGQPKGVAANYRRVYFSSDNTILFFDR